MKSFGLEFKEFIMQGNVVSLAVAVVIGAAFGALINSFVEDMITPLIAAFGGQPDFSNIAFTINGSRFMIGNFMNSLISFLIIAAIIFVFVVKPMNALIERAKTEAPVDPTVTKCPYCFSNVPVEATRCLACTSDLSGIPAPPAQIQANRLE
jgi:large conductance mechanosensitive channel